MTETLLALDAIDFCVHQFHVVAQINCADPRLYPLPRVCRCQRCGLQINGSGAQLPDIGRPAYQRDAAAPSAETQRSST